MSGGAEIIIELVPEVADALRGRSRPIDPRELGIEPPDALLLPTGADATIASMSVHITDGRRVAEALERLRSHHWIIAAYIKPRTEPPGG